MDPRDQDYRKRLPDFKQTVGTWWIKEMTNFNQKTVAVSCLIFISVIPPTLAFGAAYGKMSGNRIGAIETILATSWVGVAYSLIGGMPLCVIGSTGPALAISGDGRLSPFTPGLEAEKWNVRGHLEFRDNSLGDGGTR